MLLADQGRSDARLPDLASASEASTARTAITTDELLEKINLMLDLGATPLERLVIIANCRQSLPEDLHRHRQKQPRSNKKSNQSDAAETCRFTSPSSALMYEDKNIKTSRNHAELFPLKFESRHKISTLRISDLRTQQRQCDLFWTESRRLRPLLPTSMTSFLERRESHTTREHDARPSYTKTVTTRYLKLLPDVLAECTLRTIHKGHPFEHFKNCVWGQIR